MFEWNEFLFYLAFDDFKKALEYLERTNSVLLKKYLKVFRDKKIRKLKYSDFINEVLLSYYTYYINISYFKDNEATLKLTQNLNEILNTNLNIEYLEERLEAEFKKLGYYFIGGYSKYYSPIIFKKLTAKEFNVEILNKKINLKVNFFNEIISSGYLDFISFSKITINHFYSSQNGLFVNEKKYKVDKPKFLISLLKHEAMHIIDLKTYGKMSNKDLEYRAILVELIYYKTINRLKSLINVASCNSRADYVSYASYIVLNELSKLIFNVEFNKNLSFLGKVKLVNKYSLELLNQHTLKIQNCLNEEIDII